VKPPTDLELLRSAVSVTAIGINVKAFISKALFSLAASVYGVQMVGPAQSASAIVGGTAADPTAHSSAGNAGSRGTLVAEKKAAEAPPAPVNDKRPYSAEAVEHYNRGIELHQSGFLNQAIAEYKAAITADPRMEEAYSNLGVIYAAQHSYSKAKDAFTHALSLKPNRPTTLNGLGTVLYAQKKFDEAKDKWLQAVTVDPNFASAYYNMGNAYDSEGKLEDAKKVFVRAIDVSPNMADSYYRLGVIMNKQHHYAQASALLHKAVKLAPEGEFSREAKRLIQLLRTEMAKGESEGKEAHASTSQSARKAPSSEQNEKLAGTEDGGKPKHPDTRAQAEPEAAEKPAQKSDDDTSPQ
jgi:tetratricopeptide (TPR) repeat protein